MQFEEDCRIRRLLLSSGCAYPPNGEWGNRVYHASALSGKHHVTDHENDLFPSTASGNRFGDICRAASSSVQNARLAAAKESRVLFLDVDRLSPCKWIVLPVPQEQQVALLKEQRIAAEFVYGDATLYVLLGSRDQTRWTKADHSTLKIAGLCSKRITFENVNEISSTELKDRLYKEFSGKASNFFGSNQYHGIGRDSCWLSSYTQLYFNSISQTAKTFVRPIANDLSLSPDREVSMPYVTYI